MTIDISDLAEPLPTADWWECTRDEYDADPSLRSSDLKDFQDCPSVYAARHIHGTMPPKKQSREMTLGTAAHSVVLEAKQPWITSTDCRATKKNGDVCGNSVSAGGMMYDLSEEIFVCGVHAKGRTNVIPTPDALTPDEERTILGIATAVLGHPDAKILLSDRYHERAGRSVDGETGVRKKALIDILKPRPFVLGDLKTTSEFNPDAIWRKIDSNCWLLSMAHYESVILDIQRAHEKPVHWPDWVFLVVESVPPFRVTDWPIDINVQDATRAEYRALLAEFAECQRTGEWKQKKINTAVPQWYGYRHGMMDEGSR